MKTAHPGMGGWVGGGMGGWVGGRRGLRGEYRISSLVK
jgi:hypothetical protein